MLLIHGDDDRNVPFSETKWLAEKLAALGVDHEVLVFPDDVHGFLLHRNWVRAFEAAADFLERKLRSATPLSPHAGRGEGEGLAGSHSRGAAPFPRRKLRLMPASTPL